MKMTLTVLRGSRIPLKLSQLRHPAEPWNSPGLCTRTGLFLSRVKALIL